jgi:hypothetical protein
VAVHLLWVTVRVELDQAPIDEPEAAVAIEDAREAADRDPAPIRCEERCARTLSMGIRVSSGTNSRFTWKCCDPSGNVLSVHRSVTVVNVSIPQSSRMKSSKNVSVYDSLIRSGPPAWTAPALNVPRMRATPMDRMRARRFMA